MELLAGNNSKYFLNLSMIFDKIFGTLSFILDDAKIDISPANSFVFLF